MSDVFKVSILKNDTIDNILVFNGNGSKDVFTSEEQSHIQEHGILIHYIDMKIRIAPNTQNKPTIPILAS